MSDGGWSAWGHDADPLLFDAPWTMDGRFQGAHLSSATEAGATEAGATVWADPRAGSAGSLTFAALQPAPADPALTDPAFPGAGPQAGSLPAVGIGMAVDIGLPFDIGMTARGGIAAADPAAPASATAMTTIPSTVPPGTGAVAPDGAAAGGKPMLLEGLDSSAAPVALTASAARDYGLLPEEAGWPAGGPPAVTWAGSVADQADVAMRVDSARSTYGVDGSGLRVGILSDSYNSLGGAAADIASGDLPAAGVTVLDEYDDTGSDEGRAMAQLIHDLAPGAELLFHTAFDSAASFAQGIIDLAAAGADVIVDDVIYFAEPMFQDGPIAQAIDTVAAQGVAYFSSAGNIARDGYQSAFQGSGQNLILGGGSLGELHDFDPGAGVDTTQTIYVPVGAAFALSFQWDQPFNSFASSAASGGSTSDIDIHVFDANGSLRGGGWRNNLGGDPQEVFTFTNTTSSPYLQLSISNYSGADPGLMRYAAFGSFEAVEYGGGGTVYGHAAAAGAQAVGAAWYGATPAYGTSPPQIEGFSSAGTTTVLFDTAGNRLASPQVRATPDITAVDGTNTTFFGTDTDNDGLPNFYGTSAAAPHAAAVAALMLQLDPSLTVSRIYEVLQATAIDMDDPYTAGFDTGWDAGTGYGLIQADAALAALGIASPPGGGGGGSPTPTTPTNLFVGDASANTLSGTTGNDTLMGMAGSDTLRGGLGDDSLDGGDDGDLAYGEGGADVMTGGGGADSMYGDDGGDWIEGGEGGDLLAGLNQDDVLYGNAEADLLYGNAGNDRLFGGTGDDQAHGGTGSDLVDAGDGADTIYGLWDLATFLSAGDAAQTFDANSADTLRGGAGADSIYGGNGGDWIEGGEGGDYIAGLTGGDIGYGGGGNDVMYGNSGSDSLYGGGQDDLVNGGSGSDLIEGGDGSDSLYGLWDLDTFRSAGPAAQSTDNSASDTLRGGGGGDSILGGNGSDEIDGGDDNDYLAGLTGDDTLQGGDGSDIGYGNTGADRIFGGGGNDTLNGGVGADSLEGGDGADILVGLWSVETYVQAGVLDGGYDAANADTLIGGSGNDTMTGGSGSDSLDGGSGNDEIFALWGDDTANGGIGSDRVYGNGGNDLLYGEDGDDWIDGGAGYDTVSGGAGNDTLVGIWDTDALTGGAGGDTFVSYGAGFGSHVITDFSLAEGDSLQFEGANRSVSAVQGTTWVEIQDSDGNLLFTLQGLTDPSGLTFSI